jgi:hypothetical protein
MFWGIETKMRRSVCALFRTTLVLSSLSFAPLALGQSASDKATARQVATEGIEFFRAGRYSDALDRLRRAQSLYDAPVHLLYIARSQDKLGQLVEAAENYRLLDHYALPNAAPEAWVAAVDNGRKELAALEPRVPKLRIVTEPKEVPDATVRIDDATVSSAVLGIARPVNPGHHHVEVGRKGGAPVEADVDVAESETKDVSVALPTETATPAVVSDSGGTVKAASDTGSGRSIVGFLGGLRLGAAIPTGKLFHYTDAATNIDKDLNVSDAFQAGAAIELRVGLRIARYFTPLLYVEGASLSPGGGFVPNQKIKNTTSGSFGLGLIVGTAPGKMGGFGEFDLVFVNSYALTSTTSKRLGGDCTATVTASGGAVRLAAGGVFPISRWLQISPFASALLGRFSKLDKNADCLANVGGTIPDDDVRTHGMIVLGVGGDIVLGSDIDD